ncbi:hypothetical protein VTO7225_02015 [Vibrio toranzoniae]|nr:hypothetical protein VTO7225_02015 [Vibrio toranzoniae]
MSKERTYLANAYDSLLIKSQLLPQYIVTNIKFIIFLLLVPLTT